MPSNKTFAREFPDQETTEYEALEAALQIAERDVTAAMQRFARVVEEREHAEPEAGHANHP